MRDEDHKAGHPVDKPDRSAAKGSIKARYIKNSGDHNHFNNESRVKVKVDVRVSKERTGLCSPNKRI